MSVEDLTLKEMRSAIELMSELSEATMTHGMVIVGEPEHKCEKGDGEDIWEGMPKFSDFDMRVFLAYEQSAIAICRMVREGLIANGWTELTVEVGE